MSYATLTTDNARIAAIHDIEDMLDLALRGAALVLGSYVRNVIVPSLDIPSKLLSTTPEPVDRYRSEGRRSKDEYLCLPTEINSVSILFLNDLIFKHFIRGIGHMSTLERVEDDKRLPFTREIYAYTGRKSGVSLKIKCMVVKTSKFARKFPVDDFLENTLVYGSEWALKVSQPYLTLPDMEGEYWRDFTMNIGFRTYKRAVVSYAKMLPDWTNLRERLWCGVGTIGECDCRYHTLTSTVGLVNHIQQGYLIMLEEYAQKIKPGVDFDHEAERRLKRLNDEYLVYLPLSPTSKEWPRNPRWEGLFARIYAEQFIAENRMAGVDPDQLDWKTLGLPH